MKFSIECEVDSKIIIDGDIRIDFFNKQFLFYPDSNRFLSRIKIVADVNSPEKFYSTIRKSKEKDVKADIIINRDTELFESIINDFQELESILAFNGNLKKINWEFHKEDLICETEEERHKVGVNNFAFKKEYPDDPIYIDVNSLNRIVVTKDLYSSLTIPKAFWREGINDFQSFRYINAFFNFYFIIEGLYGNGKTKNSAVIKELYDSNEFREFIDWIITDGIKKEKRHLDVINTMLRFRNKNLDTEGLIYLLVATRGELHHFVNNPNKSQGTPFNHKNFESIAWVALGLAKRAILQKIFQINTNRNVVSVKGK